jgi:hypothetical protein
MTITNGLEGNVIAAHARNVLVLDDVVGPLSISVTITGLSGGFEFVRIPYNGRVKIDMSAVTRQIYRKVSEYKDPFDYSATTIYDLDSPYHYGAMFIRLSDDVSNLNLSYRLLNSSVQLGDGLLTDYIGSVLSRIDCTAYVPPVNSDPLAFNDAFTSEQGTTITGNVLSANPLYVDYDPDGDTITVSSFNIGGAGYLVNTLYTIPEIGTLQIDADGTIEFVPVSTYVGTFTLNYTITDGNGGSDNAQIELTITELGCLEFDRGLYSYADLQDMIYSQGYIPVASESELVSMKTSGSKTMGAGTCFEGTYTLEINNTANKFVQVREIDFTLGGAWTSAIVIKEGLYDGNSLPINNFDGEVGLLTADNTSSYCFNVTMSLNVNSSSRFVPVIDAVRSGVIANCSTSGTLITTGDASGVCSLSNGFDVEADSIICSCTSSATITGDDVSGVILDLYNRVAPNYQLDVIDCEFTGQINSVNAGGIAYYGRGDMDFTRCNSDTATITCTGTYVGGIIGQARDGIMNFDDCRTKDSTISSSVASASSDQGYGGIIGFKHTVTLSMTRCTVSNTTVSSPSGRYVGGLCGRARVSTDSSLYENCAVIGGEMESEYVGGALHGLNDNETMNNCLSTALITGATVAGGLIGVATASSTVNNSYWDTDTSGTLVSSKGTGYTTSELQTPTTDTGIYVNWDDAVWNFGTSVQYPSIPVDNERFLCYESSPGDIIVEMGQSNMEGRFGDSPLHTTSNGYYFDVVKTIPLLNDRGGATGGSHATYFAEQYHTLTGRTPIMVEVARGATGLTSTSSVINYSDGGGMRELAETTIATALFRVPSATNITAALWCQGEQDAYQMDIDGAYTPAIVKAAMQSVIDWWKTTYPGVPFLISRTGRPVSGDTTGYEDIRQIQDEIVAENTDVYMAFTGAVDFPDEGKMGDDVHYNYIGLQEMGEAFAFKLYEIL